MLSRVNLLVATTAISVLFAGCAKKEEAPAPDPIKPVKTILLDAPDVGGVRTFPARVDANERAELSFRVSGKVVKLPIKEGDFVKQGQVIAELDKTDFKVVLSDRQATYDKTNKEFIRAQKLIKDGFISQNDFDSIQANFRSAKAALEQAKLDLSYTTLKAPFAGLIAKRNIQNFEEVSAKQEIISLRDTKVVEIKFDVPERVMMLATDIDHAQKREEMPSDVSVSAVFPKSDKRYPLEFKEVSTKADEETQTFQVTFKMNNPKELNLLPGMTASAIVDMSKLDSTQEIYYVPTSAVISSSDLESTVWKFDPSTKTANAFKVKTGNLAGNDIEILEGVQSGDRIIIAGASFLTEGQKVRLIDFPEQAEGRPEF